ncbi:MAG: hypothetical protein EBT47_09225 [Chloroflexi bacterium]|nr:hypothetical protein [Chloroflexota bacterium]
MPGGLEVVDREFGNRGLDERPPADPTAHGEVEPWVGGIGPRHFRLPACDVGSRSDCRQVVEPRRLRGCVGNQFGQPDVWQDDAKVPPKAPCRQVAGRVRIIGRAGDIGQVGRSSQRRQRDRPRGRDPSPVEHSLWWSPSTTVVKAGRRLGGWFRRC